MKLIKREIKEIMLQKKKCLFYLPNQYIGIISEGSCDTEDWSNNAKNSALNTLHFIKKKKNHNIMILRIQQYYCIVINAVLLRRKTTF